MNNKLFVSSTPHITSTVSTMYMMIVMALALVPTSVFAVVNFGIRVVYLILIGVGTSYALEKVLNLLKDKNGQWLDFSSVVTGLMVTLVMPVSVPLWMPALGSAIAIFVFKFCFGGLSKNVFNPTAAARVILSVMFSGLNLSLFTGTAIGENVASPLHYFAMGDYATINLRSMFFGSVPGAMGTVAIITILACGIILMFLKITDFVVPVGAVVTFVASVWIFKGAVGIIPYLFAGSFLFACVFMITDPVTSPNTVWGRLVYGLLFGIFAGLFMTKNVMGETGVFVAVLIVNLIAPLLDKIFMPRPLGLKEVK